MKLQVLRQGNTGEAVRQWQLFLRGDGFLNEVADGIFGPISDAATRNYQTAKGLNPDGVVGPNTYAQAIKDGWAIFEDALEFPPQPDFPPLLGTTARQRIFGKFEFVPAPTPQNKERIKIIGGWAKDSLISSNIPELRGIKVYGRPSSGRIKFHIKAVEQLNALWTSWRKNDLTQLVHSYGGSFVARFIRGSRETLSNHAFGSAFDINMEWNALGKIPAAVGAQGSVRELVPIANEFGFYWGGHFKSRPDGMHFEIARLLSPKELANLKQKYRLGT